MSAPDPVLAPSTNHGPGWGWDNFGALGRWFSHFFGDDGKLKDEAVLGVDWSKLPTADPETDGAIWLDSGVLTLSSGTP